MQGLVQILITFPQNNQMQRKRKKAMTMKHLEGVQNQEHAANPKNARTASFAVTVLS